MDRVTYHVEASRPGKEWVLDTREAVGARALVRRLTDAEDKIRPVIAAVTGTDPDSFDIVVDPVLPDSSATAVARARAASEALERAEEARDTARRDAITALKGEGLVDRDIGPLLGISPQRVSQLAQGQ